MKSFYPKHFELQAITIELGFEGMDFSPVQKLCSELNIPYTCLKTDIKEIVFDIRKEENPCPMDKTSKRHEIKSLLTELCRDYPDMKSKVFGAMQRYPLEGWKPAETWRFII